MSSIIVGRTRARSQAIQLVFQAESQGVDVFDLLSGNEYALDEGPADKYALELARGVAVNRIAIDRLMGSISHNWNLSRMPLVDRCIMAIAIFEIFGVERVPASVAISEAVELSKIYGTDDSSSFVNGILGKVAKLADANPGEPLARVAQMAAAGDIPTDDASPEAPVADAPEADVPAASTEAPADIQPVEDAAASVDEACPMESLVEAHDFAEAGEGGLVTNERAPHDGE